MAIQHPTQIIKSQDTIIKVGALAAGKRAAITVSTDGSFTMPTTNVPSDMYYLGGVTNASVAFSDAEQEYYILGGGGFADSVKTTFRCNASVTSYFQKDFDTTLDNTGYDEGMDLIARSRAEKDLELHTEIYKHCGGTTYDVVTFAATVMNYSESYPADNLIEVTFDLMSRGTIGIGRATISGTIMPTAHQT